MVSALIRASSDGRTEEKISQEKLLPSSHTAKSPEPVTSSIDPTVTASGKPDQIRRPSPAPSVRVGQTLDTKAGTSRDPTVTESDKLDQVT
jgi:hypothetical protein